MTRCTRWIPAAFVALSMMGAGSVREAHAHGKSTTAMDDAGRVRSVMQLLHATNRSAIDDAAIARDRAQSKELKAYADQVARTHGEIDKKLTELAQKRGVSLDVPRNDPLYAAVIATHDDRSRELRKKSGAAFDARFLAAEPTEQAFALNLIEEGQKAASKSNDEDGKQLFGEARERISRQRDVAVKLVDRMQLAPTAIGGGPPAASEKARRNQQKPRKLPDSIEPTPIAPEVSPPPRTLPPKERFDPLVPPEQQLP